MRIFCPEHKRGFFTPRQSPIRCENKGHILGELDFNGEAKAPFALRWQYCCNCEHFCPIDDLKNGLERCPACTRRVSLLYLCDRCSTISFESSTPIQTKNFTLTSEGSPQPACPGCLQATSADLREHVCDVLGISLITALNSCPVCQERLDVGPSFPSSVAHYLKRTKTANKVNVTFDYETELFVPVEDGEFVLVSNGDEAIQPIVLPRSARFATTRDFYEFYQDYYHCSNPNVGEVQIIRPAAVASSPGGWKFQAPGILEVVVENHSQKKAADGTAHEVNSSARQEQRLSIAEKDEGPPVTPCAHCGSLVETKYAFCWKCGSPLVSKRKSPVPNAESRTATIPSEVSAEEEKITVQHDARSARAPLFSWALAKEPEDTGSTKGSVMKVVAVAAVALLLVSLGLFGLARSAWRMTSVTAAQAVAPQVQSDPNLASHPERNSSVASEATSQPNLAAASQDDELKKLRERRITATASDNSAVLQAFAKAEKQYPHDYRFPYERAKLTIRGSQSSSHAETFNALVLAAETAINSGKANEMLADLEADKAADLHKLSRGHHEWMQLVAALKSKDTKLLRSKIQV